MCVYIYIYMLCIHTYVRIHIYIYIYRDGKRGTTHFTHFEMCVFSNFELYEINTHSVFTHFTHLRFPPFSIPLALAECLQRSPGRSSRCHAFAPSTSRTAASACRGQKIAHRKSTPRKSSWIFSGMFNGCSVAVSN